MKIADVLASEIQEARDWTERLIADLNGPDWTFQPAAGLAHPLWLCGHLACAQHLLVHVRCLGGGVLEDAFLGHFPIGGPVASAQDYDYPTPDEVVETMRRVHERTVYVVREMPEELLAEPAFGKDGEPHPHYKDKRGAVSHCARHEAFHAGQLAMIRRLAGKPFLR